MVSDSSLHERPPLNLELCRFRLYWTPIHSFSPATAPLPLTPPAASYSIPLNHYPPYLIAIRGAIPRFDHDISYPLISTRLRPCRMGEEEESINTAGNKRGIPALPRPRRAVLVYGIEHRPHASVPSFRAPAILSSNLPVRRPGFVSL